MPDRNIRTPVHVGAFRQRCDVSGTIPTAGESFGRFVNSVPAEMVPDGTQCGITLLPWVALCLCVALVADYDFALSRADGAQRACSCDGLRFPNLLFKKTNATRRISAQCSTAHFR